MDGRGLSAVRRSSGAPRPGRRVLGAIPGNCPSEQRRGGAPRGRVETKTEIGDSKIIISENCAFQRNVLPSQGYGSPAPPTFTEPFSRRVAHSLGCRPAPSAEEPRALPRAASRSCPPCRAVGNASATCPPPAARSPAIGWRCCPSRGGGRVPRRQALQLVVTAAAVRAAPVRRGSRWWRRRNWRRLRVS